jgi:hypothetical protein
MGAINKPAHEGIGQCIPQSRYPDERSSRQWPQTRHIGEKEKQEEGACRSSDGRANITHPKGQLCAQ